MTSLRRLLQSPVFTVTAIATIALGIGANSAIFTVVNTVILRPLHYPQSDRIVNIGRPRNGGVSEPLFTFWLVNHPGLEDLSAFRAGASMNLDGSSRPELVRTLVASRNYFRLFGGRPILGRTFTAAEDSPGGKRVLVMSYGLWQRRFGADTTILGTTVRLGGATHTVIGVLQPGFQPYPDADVWIPLQADAASGNLANILNVSGRLMDGTTLDSMNAQLAVIDQRYSRTHSQKLGIDPRIRATWLEQRITGDIRPALLILQGAVMLVLLIACANVANLLLARATARRKEIAIRAALGAGRGSIVRQLLAESLLLFLLGGAAGLALGSWGVRALFGFLPPDLPRLREVAEMPALDPFVAALTLAVALITGILFGLVPALQASRGDLTAALNESGSRSGATPAQSRTRAVLVAAEMAISVVLLCGALLLIRSFAAMHDGKLGFDSRNVLTVEVSFAGPGYAAASALDRVAHDVAARLERVPGVQSAALASALPLWGQIDMIFNIPGQSPPPDRPFSGDVQWRYVSPQYFDVLRIPLISGRLFRDPEPGRTVIISQTMARKFWPGADAVGQSIFIGPGLGTDYQEGIAQIVGVVGDVRERLDIDSQPVMYQLPAQIPDGDMALLNNYERSGIVIRTKPGVRPAAISPLVQNALLNGDALPAARIQTMAQTTMDSTARQNFNLLLLAIFAAIAVLLATVGIYGVMSYVVQQRTSEIGIRAALGATRRDTLRLVLMQALHMSGGGVAIGILASFGFMRLLSSQLYKVYYWDPITFAAVPVVLIMIALAAAWIPALRATRVDPMSALRHE